jgi:hypothetical protein
MEEEPGHLSSMDVPDWHICVDVVHVGGFGSCGAVVCEGEVLAVGVFEDGWGEEGSVDGCIDFGLGLLVDGGDVESF